MSDFTMISLVREGRVARLTLKRPPLNVLNIAMMREIIAALREARSYTDAALLVIDAEGKAFSAGVDVGEHTADLVHEMMGTFGELFRELDAIAYPTLAVVRGAALGGGCELAIMCDMIVASEKAKFGQPEVLVGVFPPVAAAVFPVLVGRNRAVEWLLSGDTMPAAEAASYGLVNRVFTEDGFDEQLAAFIARFTRNSACVMAFAKRSIDVRKEILAHIHTAEEIYLGELMRTHDADEGLKAFLEKRHASWQDR